jgi:vancomycin resistance protein YoaR
MTLEFFIFSFLIPSFLHHTGGVRIGRLIIGCSRDARIARLYACMFGCIGIIGLFPQFAHAALPNITYRYKHHIFVISAWQMTGWEGQKEIWTYNGQPVVPPAELRVDGDIIDPIPAGFAKEFQPAWNEEAIAATISAAISSTLDRSAGNVTISRNASGTIVFDGVGFPGRSVDTRAAARLTAEALSSGVIDIMLPVIETQPQVTVLDEELRSKGITELVTLGESDFHGSTKNRIHNVTTGLNKFNGHLIEKDETFSFVKTLGPVDASTGYLKELTILGDKTVPDYGGGLCQVSSTAYRGVWEYGFPITQRKNHSYAVHYYAPQGTDATVYPPNVDIKFKNDSPGALLMQTMIDVPNMKAYFLYYGTRDARTSNIIGPFSWDFHGAPPPKTEETTEIPVGTRRKVGEAVNGMRTAWFRTVEQDGKETVQGTYSIYQARPLFYQIGVDRLTTGSGSLTEAGAGESVISD